MINRKEEIKKKGFAMTMNDTPDDAMFNSHNLVDFSKIKVGAKILDDAILNLGTFKKIDARLGNKEAVLRAIYNNDYETMREISDFFFKTSGIYARLCKYMANLYRYDWMVTPFVNSDSLKTEKILDGFHKSLNILDNFEVKRTLGEIALKVIRYGCYYGYMIHQPNGKTVIQELPPNYCRSRYNVNGQPAVEFNMKFFDDTFRDTTQKVKMLNLFPKEFKKGYILYKEGKLPAEYMGDTSGWYLLSPEFTVKFNTNGEDFPMFISVIPAIIDLDEAQELDRKKMAQKLLKIVIQKMPLDKNGDLIFDIDEAQALHNNAVQMLAKAIGIDVLTTFAEVDVADMSDSTTSANNDELEKVERAVFNDAGVSQLQFNATGNIALQYSIANDEAAMSTMIEQFKYFINTLLTQYNKSPKKFYIRADILPTTIYNYKELAKLYKENTQMGYSKIFPQLALGQSQSSILATMTFENDVLGLAEKLVPPMTSNTMSGKAVTTDSNNKGGRPKKEDADKATKTLQNEESQS